MNKERRQNSDISQKISPTHKQTCFKKIIRCTFFSATEMTVHTDNFSNHKEVKN